MVSEPSAALSCGTNTSFLEGPYYSVIPGLGLSSCRCCVLLSFQFCSSGPNSNSMADNKAKSMLSGWAANSAEKAGRGLGAMRELRVLSSSSVSRMDARGPSPHLKICKCQGRMKNKFTRINHQSINKSNEAPYKANYYL